jgi:hypothetical protein
MAPRERDHHHGSSPDVAVMSSDIIAAITGDGGSSPPLPLSRLRPRHEVPIQRAMSAEDPPPTSPGSRHSWGGGAAARRLRGANASAGGSSQSDSFFRAPVKASPVPHWLRHVVRSGCSDWRAHVL